MKLAQVTKKSRVKVRTTGWEEPSHFRRDVPDVLLDTIRAEAGAEASLRAVRTRPA